MSKGARWFVARMPSRDVLDGLLADDSVGQLIAISKDRAIANSALDLRARANQDAALVEASLKVALAAAARIAKQGDQASLSDQEEAALELFLLLVSRPSLFVRGGRVVGRPDNWPEIARDSELFPDVVAGVGRLQQATGTKIGSGFITGDRRVLTNNHVVGALLGLKLSYWRDAPTEFAAACTEANKEWEQGPASRPVFELVGEVESTASVTARVVRIAGHHAAVDMAVLELDAAPAGSRRLPLASAEPKHLRGRKVFAVGYPTDDARTVWGERVTPVPIFQRVFGTDPATLGTKRLAPGIVLDSTDDEFFHDASTLPGSSGSCIIDFDDQQVIGLHYGGSFAQERNFAVKLWRFSKDPLLIDNGVVFA
jgi:endonuclease G